MKFHSIIITTGLLKTELIKKLIKIYPKINKLKDKKIRELIVFLLKNSSFNFFLVDFIFLEWYL
jgi:hypothetical protein